MYHSRSVVACLIIVIVCFLTIDRCQSTPLDDYVNLPDSHFEWHVINTYKQPDYVLYILNFTSQQWFNESFSTRSIWWHFLCITVPNNLTRPNSAFMLIDGGSNNDAIPKPEDNFVALTSMLGASSGSISVDLQAIPNEPTRFMADPTGRNRMEDAIIAWTWKSFIDNTSNPYELILMPMTKAAVRAMDAVQQFATQLGIPVPGTFVISGASKRGWTTWTTAAVDNVRVIGAIPIVMDMANFQKSLHHHFRSLNGWTFAFKDYYELNITLSVDNPNLPKMSEIIDPYYYFERYKKTKILQVQSAGDEFFLLDNEDTFWQELQTVTGGTYLRRLPNADHSCAGHEISLFWTMRSFYLSVYENRPFPSLHWNKTSNNTHGYIRAVVDFSYGPKPISAFGYHARTLNDQRRDFRLLIADPNHPGKATPNPVIWFRAPVVTEGQTSTTIAYSLTIESPSSGWEGFFIQINFAGPDGTILELTTETQVIPDTYPTADCFNEGCFGSLV
ncbi:unnamed protein product [Rotaria magnacalcarata]|uniref:Uncharacterized protein n=2 Tax=Rotaria magnacalcarata TaxID=392030 RepID=A0A816N1S4_9BILA|nr:unnamed protein product [Rotaria magnacalcarata]CAF1617181.1 unnamed protein product [Rotaria magnacalcarata]CAF2032527.1 unnamed protein product [Rotaria magnacalcarata]CAF3920020.1 unnamed protein product [Rotaria magnacalcarata]CAF4141442.1 unnamed protein product [Rotaria magnacalcarata]